MGRPRGKSTRTEADNKRLHEEHAAVMRKRQREITAAGQDVGPIPPVENEERRALALSDFYFFAETYFSELFTDQFSKNHRYNIDTVINTHGSLRHVFNLPRRWGKTTVMTIVLLYLIFRGEVRYAFIIAANEDKAEEILESLLMELDNNELLLEDFPEICHPFHALERRSTRAKGQKVDGEFTRISTNAGEIRFPMIAGSSASGAVVTACGVSSKTLGSRKRIEGGVIRPDFVLLDDVQDEESSASFSQTEKLKKTIQKTLKYLPDKKTPCKIVINCTVRNRDDLADSYLKDVRWSGRRCGLFEKMPSDLTAWRNYGEHHEKILEMHRNLEAGARERTVRESINRYYEDHRTELDSGFVANWDCAKTPVHVSAVQAGMENWLEDEVAFWSEDMNTPLAELYQDSEDMTFDAILSKVVPTKRYQLPNDTREIVAAVDIHETMLSYLILAGGEEFSTHVTDYGVWPEQRSRAVVHPENVPIKISERFPGMSVEDAVYESLDSLVEKIMGTRYVRGDGSEPNISRILIDAKYGPLTATVRKYCRNSKHRNIILSSFSAERTRFTTNKKVGEIWDRNSTWKIPVTKTGMTERYMLFDGNHWKTFALKRVQSSLGNRSTLTIYDGDKSHHAQLLSDWTAEYHETIATKSGTETRWRDKPGKRNRSHLWDCLVMCFVSLSERGFSLASNQKNRAGEKKTVSFSQMQKEAMRGRS